MKIPGWFWIVFVVVILTGSLLAGGIMLFVSWDHPSLAVDDNYYQRAVSYDDFKAQAANNLRLQWELDLYLERQTNAGIRETLVQLSVLDGAGEPLENAEVSMEAFHLAWTGERFHQVLSTTSPGVYAEHMPLRRVGIWEFRCIIRRGEDTFTAVLEKEF